jgi:hypothetical protein
MTKQDQTTLRFKAHLVGNLANVICGETISTLNKPKNILIMKKTEFSTSKMVDMFFEK